MEAANNGESESDFRRRISFAYLQYNYYIKNIKLEKTERSFIMLEQENEVTFAHNYGNN